MDKAVRWMDEAYTHDLAAICKVGGVWRESSQVDGIGLHMRLGRDFEGGRGVERGQSGTWCGAGSRMDGRGLYA